MSENSPEPTPPLENDKPDLNPRLKARLAIAAGLVVAALATIPLLDSLSSSSSQPKAPTSVDTNTPAQDETLSKIAGTEGAIIPVVEPPPTEANDPNSGTHALNNSSAPLAPTETAPVRPDTSKTPGMHATRPLALPSGPMQGKSGLSTEPLTSSPSLAPEPTVVTPTQKPTKTPGPVIAASIFPSSTQTKPSQHTDGAMASPLTSINKARPVGSSKGYNVQMGLFMSIQNAQKLIEELRGKGINAHTETRVQLGPFSSRVEAEDTLKRLKSLGYSPLLVPAGG